MTDYAGQQSPQESISSQGKKSSNHKERHQPLHVCVLKGEKTIGKKYSAKGKKSLGKNKNVSAPYRGKGKVCEVATMADFAKLIESLGNRHCLTMGVPIEGRSNFRYTTKGNWQESMLDQDPPTITRTSNFFCWPDTPGFILLEHDPGHWDGEPITSPEHMLSHLADTFPLIDWHELGHVWYTSVNLHPKLPQDLHRKLPHPESLIMAHI